MSLWSDTGSVSDRVSDFHYALKRDQIQAWEFLIWDATEATNRQTGYSRSDRQLPHQAEEAGEGERARAGEREREGEGESEDGSLQSDPEHRNLRETQPTEPLLTGQTLWLQEEEEEKARSGDNY